MKVLIVGTGSIGTRHLRNLLDMRERKGLVVEVAEPDPAGRERVREGLDVRVHESMEHAMDESAYDAAILCSPNHFHVSQTVLALSSGCRVFVEKPLCLDMAEAESLYSIVRESSSQLMVGCNLRFHPGVKALRDALGRDLVGRPYYAQAHFAHYLPNWRPGFDYRATYSANKDQGGGILLDAVHEPDYLCWLFGKARNVRGELLRLGELEIDVEDTAMFRVAHESDVISEVHLDYLRRDKSRGCVVACSRGTIVWESTAKNPEKVLVRCFDAGSNTWSVLCDETEYDLNGQYVEEMEYFLDAAVSGRSVMNGLHEAVHTMAVLEAVRRSSDSGCVEKVLAGVEQ